MNNNEMRIVGLCRGLRQKRKVHKVHIQSDDPMFFRAWEESTKEINLYNGWTKKVLRLEGVKVVVLGMIRSDGLGANYQGVIVSSGRKYLDMWVGPPRSLFVKKLLETVSRGKKIIPRLRACPACFRKYLKENHNRLR